MADDRKSPRSDSEVGELLDVDPSEVGGFLFWRASLRWQRTMTAALRPLELTHVQFITLSCARRLMSDREKGPTQRELADAAGADVMMISQVVSALERRGLVARLMDPNDRRVKRVAITSEGRRLVERAVQVAFDADREFFAVTGGAEGLLPALRALASWQSDV